MLWNFVGARREAVVRLNQAVMAFLGLAVFSNQTSC
jgi:hypothetical protein